MISDPGRYLDDYLKAGCDCVTVHIEAVGNPGPLLRRIRAAGAVSGLSLNPNTPVDRIEPFLDDCDLVLVMSVEPGFGGQSFIPSALEKLRRLRGLIPPSTLLSVDGGIGLKTIASASAAGADVFVAGSSILETDDYGRSIAELTTMAADARAGHSTVSPP
jgi:ribulose-phosphate 3-epimerase